MKSKRKTFEILSFISVHDYSIFRANLIDERRKNKNFNSTFNPKNINSLVETNDKMDIKYLLRGNNWILHSIRRTSDGTIFTLGDVIKSLGRHAEKTYITFMNTDYNNVRFYNNGVYFQTLSKSHKYVKTKLWKNHV